MHDLGLVPALVEIVRDQRGDIVVVFDDQNARHGVSSCPFGRNSVSILAQNCG
jgi:hypothetical protein